jgi:hypothetical protein
MTKMPLRNHSLGDGSNVSRLLRTLIDSLPDHVYVKETQGRYLLNTTTANTPKL